MAKRFDPHAVLDENPNIELVYKSLPRGLKAYRASYGEITIITMSRSLARTEERCYLTHELGHIFLGHSGNCLTGKHQGGLSPAKQEYAAMVWATDRLIDSRELRSIIWSRRYLLPDEVYEHFDVLPEYMTFKIQHLINTGSLKIFYA